MGEILRNIVKM